MKGLEDQIQKITDGFIAQVDKHVEAKEKENDDLSSGSGVSGGFGFWVL